MAVAKGSQSLVANAASAALVVGQTTTLSATGGSGTGAVSFASNDGSCSVTGTTLTAASTGSCMITATRAADANYIVATASVGITIAKAGTAASITSHTPNPSQQTTPIAVTIGVTVNSPGAITPTAPSGIVTISDGAASCSATLPTTSCNLTPSTIGSKTLTATYSGDANFNGSVSAGTGHAVTSYCNFDVDGNTRVDALTDGLIIFRYLLGVRGSALVANALAPDAKVTDPDEIAAKIALMVSNFALDIDGNTGIAPESDGLLLLRALAGNTNVIDALGSGTPTRNTWALIRGYLNSACGMTVP